MGFVDVVVGYVLVVRDLVVVAVVLQFFELLFKGVIADWWKDSFTKEVIAANGEVVYSL
jgi:hypothetical protein